MSTAAKLASCAHHYGLTDGCDRSLQYCICCAIFAAIPSTAQNNGRTLDTGRRRLSFSSRRLFWHTIVRRCLHSNYCLRATGPDIFVDASPSAVVLRLSGMFSLRDTAQFRPTEEIPWWSPRFSLFSKDNFLTGTAAVRRITQSSLAAGPPRQYLTLQNLPADRTPDMTSECFCIPRMEG